VLLASADTRQVASNVLVNGASLAGVESIAVINNLYLGANRFSISAAITPGTTEIWSAVPLSIEVQIGLDGGWASLILGDADSIEIDPIRQDIHLAGRDLTARFLMSQTQQTFENQTSSEIVSGIVGRHGLIPQVTATSTLVGRYFGTSRTRTAMYQNARATNDWDLLVWLAEIEGFDLWVDGSTLYFQPPSTTESMLTVCPSDCLELNLHRSLDIAAGVSIQVKSWDCQSQQSVSQTLSSLNASNSNISLVIVRPNLPTEDATLIAQQALAQMTAHERVVSFTMPADITSTPRMTIQLACTGTDFDGTYQISEIERRFSLREGFVQHVRARSVTWTPSSTT
jgi:phage protein D